MPPARIPPPARALFAACLIPAAGTSQTLSYSRFDFSNAYRIEREDAWPNARASGGNVKGDFAYKVFPVEVLGRDKEIRISGLRLSFTLGNGYKGAFPVMLAVPEVAFFPVVVGKAGGRTLPLPDPARPHAVRLTPPPLRVPRDGVFTVELRLGPGQPDPRLRKPVVLPARDGAGAPQGWAIALMAPPGERLGDGKPHLVPVPSFGEIHRAGSPATFSGFYDAKTKRLIPYGSPGAPSNLGELGIEVLLDQPALQIRSPAAGGVLNDPRRIETHLGPGAYWSGLATAVRAGGFGFYAQWEGREADALLCLPLLTALGGARPKGRLALPGGALFFAPQRAALGFFAGLGMLGPIARYKAFGPAGRASDQRGVYVSGLVPVPRDPALAGAVLWIQAVFVDPRRGPAGVSNLVRLEL